MTLSVEAARTLIDNVKEIHETIVKGKPAEDELLNAAKRVVEVRYRSGGEWEELSEAILELANIVDGG